MATVLHLITGLETGGAEHTLARLVARLDGERHRSIVVSLTGLGAVGPMLEEAGISVFSLDIGRGRPDPRGVFRLVRLLRRVRPDVLQTWLYHADLLGLLARPAVPFCRLFWNIRCTESIEAGLVRRLLAARSHAPDAVVVNSRAGRRFHEAIGYRPRRWVFIPNGCDTQVFRFDPGARTSVRGELGIPDNAVAIGLPARFHPMKDHTTFLAAARLLASRRPESVFVLAGAGIDRANPVLRDAIAAQGLAARVHLLGERRDMARVYSALDIASLSSSFGEGCPNVVAEAMACGLPCAATNCGDAAELIGPAGRVVPVRDPAALAAAWEALCALGADGRRALGAAARGRIVDGYDLGRVAARYDALYA
jgi:glycosyltransferase involved in cell wall biosynthesis